MKTSLLKSLDRAIRFDSVFEDFEPDLDSDSGVFKHPDDIRTGDSGIIHLPEIDHELVYNGSPTDSYE
jgi:hypothetical protein